MIGTKKKNKQIKVEMIVNLRLTAGQRKINWRIRSQQRNRKQLAPTALVQVQDLMLDRSLMHRGRLRITEIISLIVSRTKVTLS
jgi:hypothetical protein